MRNSAQVCQENLNKHLKHSNYGLSFLNLTGSLRSTVNNSVMDLKKCFLFEKEERKIQSNTVTGGGKLKTNFLKKKHQSLHAVVPITQHIVASQ